MSRSIGASNITEIGGALVRPIILVKLEYTPAVYVHSGVGNIVYDSDTYIGVGAFGGISAVEEKERINPAPIRLQLSGVDADFITEAFDSGNFGDQVTIFQGYRGADDDLVTDPWVMFRGYVENSSIEVGANNAITVTVQNNLRRIEEKNGRRFTNEDQQNEFSSDEFFKFVHDAIDKTVLWGSRFLGAGRPNSDFVPRDGEELR